MNSIPLPAFQDDDLSHDGYGDRAAEPGDAQPVLDCLQRDGLQPEPILVTHLRLDDSGDSDATRQTAGRRRERPKRAPRNPGFTFGAEPVRLQLIHFGRRCKQGRQADLPGSALRPPAGTADGPFLRTRLTGVAQAARGFSGAETEDSRVDARRSDATNE